MELDLEQIAIALQRRYGYLREIRRLTGEMQDSVSRQDEYSFVLLLQMRAEEIARYDASREELWSQAEKGKDALRRLKHLLKDDPQTVKEFLDPMEKKIYELRKKTIVLIQDIQAQDKRLSYRVNGRP